MDRLDCLIVGGGPAGLTAALYLARFRRNVALVDGGQSRAALIPVSHNFPGFPHGVTGSLLLDRLREQLAPYPVTVIEGLVEKLEKTADGFRADLGTRTVAARTVLLATGINDAGMAVPNWRAGVEGGALRLCPVCDAYEVIDTAVAIIARSEGAAAHARFLSSYTPRLTLIHAVEDASLPAAEVAALMAEGITVIESRDVFLRVDASGKTCVEIDGRRHDFDSVYPMFGCRPRTGLAAALGAHCDDAGKLTTDAFQQTSVAGLYAAGDVVSGLNQISVAAGQAAIAATHINHQLG